MKAIIQSNILKVLLANIIVEEGFNVREDYGDIDALAKSIAKLGQKVPLRGRRKGDEITITAGHRRLAAIKLANSKYGANIERVSVISFTGSEQDKVLEMLLDGEGVKNLTNEEMVKGIKRLLDAGMKKKDIIDSLAIGKSQAQKYNLVKAAKAPKAVQQLLDDGVISVAVVNRLQREAKNEKELVDMAQEEVANGKGKSTKKKVSPIVAKLEDAIELSDATKPKVAILKAIVNKLKSNASAEDIAKLLK